MSVTGVMDRPPGLGSPSSFWFATPPPLFQQASVLPGDLSQITVTGTFLSFTGAASTGTVTFTPSSAPLKDTASVEFTGAPVVATLNASGAISVNIICTGNTDLSPSVWTYTITTNINGVSSSYPGKQIPYSPNSTIDLTALLP